jgi:hypothetical protein
MSDKDTLKAWRDARELTNDKAAALLAASPATFKNWLYGATPIPSDTLELITLNAIKACPLPGRLPTLTDLVGSLKSFLAENELSIKAFADQTGANYASLRNIASGNQPFSRKRFCLLIGRYNRKNLKTFDSTAFLKFQNP